MIKLKEVYDLEALNNIAVYSAIHNHLLDGSIKEIEKELQKPQQLYDLIKQKRDNAKQDYLNEKESPIINGNKIDYLKGQIAAYNDVLSLMESMK